jgi:hypothetical protein
MADLVDLMMKKQQRRSAERNPEILRHLETEIAAVGRRIDRLVYELYGLTDEEIALVEGA